MDELSLDPELDDGGGSYDTGGNPVDAAYNDANGPPPGAVRTEEPGIYQNPDGTFWFAPVTVTETRGPDSQPPSFGGMGFLSELLGIGSAQAGEANLPLPVAGNPRAVGSAAEQWAAQGKLDSFLAANPDYAKTINNSFWDNLSGSYMSQLQDKNKAALTPSPMTPTPVLTNPTFTDASGAQYLSPHGVTVQDITLSPVDNSGINISPNTTVTTDFTGIGNVGNTGDRSGPTITGDVSTFLDSYYGDQRADALGGQSSAQVPAGTTTVAGNTINTLGLSPLTVAKPVITPGGSTWAGPTTNLIGSGSGDDTAMSATGYEKNVPKEKLWSDFPFGTGSPIGPDTGVLYTPADTTTADVTPAVVDPANATRRRYLGAGSDLYRYGMGPERTYYAAAAQGGYFNADQYFANGGLVSPMQPPSQSTVPPFPTMAFTDGGGPVGSIAQPPGLLASDSVGSDAPHASPMAPSVAASVPTMQPGLATLSMRNVNASPAPSPISQNPNVGYALGQSPLSNV
jgi:hypothetical protein